MKKLVALILVCGLVLAVTPALAKKTKTTTKKVKVYSQKKLTKYVKGLRHVVKILQDDVAALKSEQVVTKTYEGEIDVNAAGDKQTNCVLASDSGLVTCEWKEISVPELDLTKSPNVSVLLKGVLPDVVLHKDKDLPDNDGWTYNWEGNVGMTVLANGKVYVLYKAGNAVLSDGHYKVVLTYKK